MLLIKIAKQTFVTFTYYILFTEKSNVIQYLASIILNVCGQILFTFFRGQLVVEGYRNHGT